MEWLRRPATLFFLTLSGCFFCLGLIIGGLGPIVLELGRRNDMPVESVGFFVSARGIGYVVGTLTGTKMAFLLLTFVGGPLMDCGVPGNLMLAFSVTFAALSTCFITLAYSFWVNCRNSSSCLPKVVFGRVVIFTRRGDGHLRLRRQCSTLVAVQGSERQPLHAMLTFLLRSWVHRISIDRRQSHG